MKISLIVPIYNVADYIERCLLSVLNQTYADIECLLINDCTPDCSMEIVKKIMGEYSGPKNIRVINHEKNKGLSEARNTGIHNATGEYIYFLDSDDAIPEDCIEKMFNLVKLYEPDFVIGHIMEYSSKDSETEVSIAGSFVGSNSQITKLYSSHKWNMMACNKLIKRTFLLEHGLFFFPNIYHEDELWSFQLATCACRMAICHHVTYFYFHRLDSITEKRSCKHFDGMFKVVEQCNVWINTGYDRKELYPQIKTLYWTTMNELCKMDCTNQYRVFMAKKLKLLLCKRVKLSFKVYGLKDAIRFFIVLLPASTGLLICKLLK